MSNSMYALSNITLPSADLQPVVYQTLAFDAFLRAAATGVYDGEAPDKAVLPYIIIGSINETPADQLGQMARLVTFDIHVFSKMRGNKEASAIAGRIVQLLNQVALPIGDMWYVAQARFDGLTVVPDPGEARHYVCRFKYDCKARARGAV